MQLGGGHDHIFPLLKSIHETMPNKSLNIINLDAHLDTRKDASPHSGIYLDNFLDSPKKQFNLHQICIQKESNKRKFSTIAKLYDENPLY